MKKEKKIQNMLEGSPYLLLLKFSIPILIGSLIQQMYNMADSVVVGQFVGLEALAAVGSTGSLMFTTLGFSLGLTAGFTVIVSQRFGAKDEQGLQSAIAMSVYLSLIIAVAMTLLGTIYARSILKLLNTPESILGYATDYLQCVFAGSIGLIFYNLASSVLRAVGDSRVPLYFLIFSSILNVLLDLLLVIVIPLGTTGAGLATTIAQTISAILVMFYIFKRRPELFPRKEYWKWNHNIVKSLLRLGVPSAFQNSVTGIGILLMQVVVNGYGATYVAAYAAASKIQMFAMQPIVSIGIAVSTFTGQNLGANLLKRIYQGVHQGVIVIIVASLLGTSFSYFLCEPIALLFVDATEVEVIEATKSYLRTISPFYILLGLLYAYRSALQGIGNAILPMLSGFLELLLRIIATIVLPTIFGFVGVSLADVVAWIGAVILLVIGYYWQMKKCNQMSQSEGST
ncbi:MAG: MATE family efflux transporter [Eubacteriales bacterium]